MKIRLLLVTLSLLILLSVQVNAQTCTASLGDPVLNETFGAGASPYGPPLPPGITNFIYQSKDCPQDGLYSIRNFTSNCYDWGSTGDHTGDPNGYFMIINASYDPSDFYLKTVSGLCGGNTYKFSAWIFNLATKPDKISPNVTFTIEQTNGIILSSYNTGDIPVVPNETWKNYSFYFKTPIGITDVVLRMRNNAPGGNGNDLGLDDIVFQPVGPGITANIKGYSTDTISICKAKNAINLTLNASVEHCYDSTSYQWQQSVDTGKTWSDIAGATDSNFSFIANVAGYFEYRLSASQLGNINSITCRVHSSPINVNVAEPNTIINKNICIGNYYMGYSQTGTYIDSFTNANGCDSLRTLNLTVISPPKNTDTIAGIASLCTGFTSQLSDSTPNGVWKSTDTSVATITADGLVKAVTFGNTSVHYVVTNMCGADSSTKTIKVFGVPLNSKDTITKSPTCFYPFSGSIAVSATGMESPYYFIWGDSTYTIPFKVNNLGEGVYKVFIYNAESCLVDSITNIALQLINDGSCDTLYVPTGFAPLSQKGNNLLKPYGGAATITAISFKVYNRYGNLLFESNNVDDGWDGRINGVLQNSGTYIWRVDYTLNSGLRKHGKGTCVLVR